MDSPERLFAPVDIEALYQRRRTERHKLDGKPADLALPSGTVVAIVREISVSGFMAECAEPVAIGSIVSLEIPGIGRVDAQIRWQMGFRMGGMFVDPISLKECAWMAARPA